MENKMVRIPFDVEMAKKITNGEVEGRVVTRDGRNARILCFDAKNDWNIVALIENEFGVEFTVSYLSDGKFLVGKEENIDLMLEIPEYMTFKDGDILYCKGTYNWIFIYRSNGCDKTSCYAAVMGKSSAVFLGLCVMSDEEVKDLRFATEFEKQKLIETLKTSKEPKAKEYLKRFFGIEEKKECEFKPFDKVLVRDDNNEKWRIDLFSHQRDNGLYVGIEYSCKYCIHYNDQTAHLLGTTEDYKGD